MSFEEHVMSNDKCKSILSYQFKYFCDACERISFAVLDVCFTVLSSLT